MMESYRIMLEQLRNKNVDEHFIEHAGNVYQKALQTDEAERKQMAVEIHEALCERIEEKMGLIFPVYSYLLHIDANAVYMENFLKLIRVLQQDGQLSWQNAYWLFGQLNSFRLQHKDCDTQNTREMLAALIQRALACCMLQLNVAVCPKLYPYRYAKRVVVLTEKLSADNEAWRDFVLECCYVLQHSMEKEVLLVNTNEAASRAGELSFFAPQYEEEIVNHQQEELEWRGERFAFYQCQSCLTDTKDVESVISRILEYNPGMALHLGDSSFLAAIADQWLPVMTMGGTFGAAVVSGTEFAAAYDSLEEARREFLGVVKHYEQTIQEEKNLRSRLVFPSDYFKEEDRRVRYCEAGLFHQYIAKESFHIEKMMKRAWAASIKVMKEVERICKKHHILYFADWGTLLGAVRHQGFVPWDDDIDIAMKREDYNRFFAIAREELSEGYCIVDGTYDEGWPNTRARVLNVADSDHAHIHVQQEKLDEFYGCPYVVGVDIEPLDYIPRNKEEADMQAGILQNVLSVACKLQDNGSQITEDIEKELKLIEQLCNYHFTEERPYIHQLLRLASAISQMYGKEDGDEIAYMCSHSYLKNRENYRLKEEWYEDSTPLPFETTTVEVPLECMKVLKACYGNGWFAYYRGGAAHEYPFYQKQEEKLRELGIVLE
ncbi:hypothetical protein D3Z36_10085 [Lachnospiraceae bacterium]|nr:hypothetical protein [Lachnospiraceae bacterium]